MHNPLLKPVTQIQAHDLLAQLPGKLVETFADYVQTAPL
jgi:hypothetical protein